MQFNVAHLASWAKSKNVLRRPKSSAKLQNYIAQW